MKVDNGAFVVARLRALDTCAVSDALDALGLEGVLAGISPMWPCGRVAGRVQTVRLAEVGTVQSSSHAHLGAEAIAASAPGDVVVVDNRAAAGRSAGWGGLLGLAATLRGIAGVVVYGACRDVDDVAGLGLPLFATNATPRTARGRTVEVESGGELDLDGITLSVGDYLLGDRSGVVVVSSDRIEEVLGRAEGFAAREAAMAAELRAGKTVTEVLDARYETMTGAGGSPGGR